MSELEKIGNALWQLPKTGKMRVPGLVIATEELLGEISIAEPLKQVQNVAELPGIVGYSIAMPDIHWGYGFPIGGVAAMDAKDGVISPGGVGYDINCGVRLAVFDTPFSSLKNTEKLLEALYKNVPSGVGKGHKKSQGLSDHDYRMLIEKGALFSIEEGYGIAKDLQHIESHGVIKGGDPDAVSSLAKERGKNQLGTIGSGNHFIEIGEIQTLFQPEIASEWAVRKGQTYILIHSGSRGFGHQVFQDSLNEFIRLGYAEGLPDRQLVAAPITSKAGKKYFAAMAAAANFAFNNRQRILHEVRQSFNEVLGCKDEDVRMVYDVCHNIAKFEEYEVDGVNRKLCVHRKGATRAFGPGHAELAPIFQKTGQPVIVPGDMGNASHLMAGLGNTLTWCSCCHGAGRARSRVQSRKAWQNKDPVAYMKKMGVQVRAASIRTIDEEMPDAYKNVDVVVDAVEQAGLANKVARLKPCLVVKG